MPERPSRSLDDRLAKLADACRILEMERHGDKTLGHVSLRDPDGRGAWIKRGGIALGEVRGSTDFVLIGFDGKVLAGSGARHAEWPIHTEIYRARPDIQAVARTHPAHASIFAATEASIEAISREGGYFQGRVPRYCTTANLVSTVALGADVAETLGRNYALLMRNNGVVFCGRGIAECIVLGVMLERACRAQLALGRSRLEWTPAREVDQIRSKPGLVPERETVRFWNYYLRKLARQSRQPLAGAQLGSRHVG